MSEKPNWRESELHFVEQVLLSLEVGPQHHGNGVVLGELCACESADIGTPFIQPLTDPAA